MINKNLLQQKKHSSKIKYVALVFALFVLSVGVARAAEIIIGGEIISNVFLPKKIDVSAIKIGESYDKEFNVSGSGAGGFINVSHAIRSGKISLKIIDPLNAVFNVPETGSLIIENMTAGIWKIRAEGKIVGQFNDTLRILNSSGVQLVVG